MCRTVLLVTTQGQFTAYCGCRDTIKLFRLLLPPYSLTASYTRIICIIPRFAIRIKLALIRFTLRIFGLTIQDIISSIMITGRYARRRYKEAIQLSSKSSFREPGDHSSGALSRRPLFRSSLSSGVAPKISHNKSPSFGNRRGAGVTVFS